MENERVHIPEKTNTYEMGYLISGKLDPEDIEEHVRDMESIIQGEGKGVITDSQRPQKRRLAYPINKEEHAYFGAINFEVGRSTIIALQKKLKLDAKFLRHLIITVDLKKQAQTAASKRRRVPTRIKRDEEVVKTPLGTLKEKVEPQQEIKMKELEKKLDEIIEGPTEEK